VQWQFPNSVTEGKQVGVLDPEQVFETKGDFGRG